MYILFIVTVFNLCVSMVWNRPTHKILKMDMV